jgi:phasin family protein
VQATLDVQQPMMEKAMRVAQIITEANSRLFRLQREAANAAFTDTSKHINALLNTAKSPAALTELPSLYQESAQKQVEVMRSWFEILSQTQTQLSKLLGSPLASNNVGQNYFEQFTKVITDVWSTAEAQMKNFVPKAVGSIGEAPPSTKVAART